MAEMKDHDQLSPVAEFMHRMIDASGKSQRELADEIGLNSRNMLSMLKHAEVKFPISQVLPIARALHADPAHLLRLVLEQHWPGQRKIIEEIFGLTVSRNERRLIEILRKVSNNQDPALDPEEAERVLRTLSSKEEF